MEIYSYNNSKTTSWSGGKTTELFIFPNKSNYINRDFDIRISVATTEINRSEFSNLSGFKRFIMILEGELELIHQDKYVKKLKRFETDFFDGEWKTEGIGQIVDFNIIHTNKYTLDCKLKSIESEIVIENDTDHNFIFILEGNGLVDNDKVNKYDLVYFKKIFNFIPLNKCAYLDIRLKLDEN